MNDEVYEIENEAELLEEDEQTDIVERPEVVPVDLTPIAEAGARVFNGPNGEAAIKTVKTAVYVTGGVICFGLLLHYAPDIIRCFVKAAA